MIWSDEDLRTIFKTVERVGPNTRELCEVLDITPGQLGGIRRRNPEAWADAVEVFENKNPRLSPEVANRHLRDNLKLKTERAQLEGQLRAAIREESLVDVLKTAIEESVEVLPEPVDIPQKINAKMAGVTEETMVMMVGDMHASEIVKPERTRFFNEYNSVICQQRWAHYVQTHLQIKEKLEAGGGWRFPRLVIPLMGDIVAGSIHEMEKHSDTNIVKTTMGAAHMIAQGISYLARHYPEVTVLGVVGNHGRLPDQKRKVYKEPSRNWDYMAYLAIAQALSGHSNVRCFFPEAYSIQMEIYDWLFDVSHGDDVKSWGNLPAYGLDRYGRNLNSAESIRGRHIHWFLAGHWHQKVEIETGGAEIIVGGDFKGADEYVLGALGKVGQPRQNFFAVHPEHGITHRWDVKLSNPDPSAPQFSMTPWEDVTLDDDGELVQVLKIV